MRRSDKALMAAVAAGDGSACTVLFRRHYGRALAEARSRAARDDAAEDAVSVAFQSVLHCLQSGREVTNFRAYLLTAVRNTLISQSRPRSASEVPMAEFEDASTDSDSTSEMFAPTNDAMRRAFSSLTERQQTALWGIEVEKQSNREIGRQLDIEANAVAALALRARKSLRAAYVAEITVGADVHEWVEARLQRLQNDGVLSAEGRLVVEFHLEDCESCHALLPVHAQAATAPAQLGAVLLLAGVPGVGLTNWAGATGIGAGVQSMFRGESGPGVAAGAVAAAAAAVAVAVAGVVVAGSIGGGGSPGDPLAFAEVGTEAQGSPEGGASAGDDEGVSGDVPQSVSASSAEPSETRPPVEPPSQTASSDDVDDEPPSADVPPLADAPPPAPERRAAPSAPAATPTTVAGAEAGPTATTVPTTTTTEPTTTTTTVTTTATTTTMVPTTTTTVPTTTTTVPTTTTTVPTTTTTLPTVTTTTVPTTTTTTTVTTTVPTTTTTVPTTTTTVPDTTTTTVPIGVLPPQITTPQNDASMP